MEFDRKILLKQGDAIECLRQLPTDSVDLIITDPPYNLGLFMRKRGTNMNKLRDGHGVNKTGDSPNRVLLPQRTVGHVLAQTTDCDASAYAGECGIRLPAPAAEAYRLCRGLIAFHGFGILL